MIFENKEADSDLENDVSEQDDNLEEKSASSPSDDCSEEEEQTARETFTTKNNVISLSSLSHTVAGRTENVNRMLRSHCSLKQPR